MPARSTDPSIWPILIAVLAGAAVGALAGPDVRIAGIAFAPLLDFFGTLFINALKMLVVPLVAASIVTGVANLGSSSTLGRLSARTLLFYVLTTLIAVLVALTVVNLVRPGIIDGQPARDLLALQADASAVAATVEKRASAGVLDLLIDIVPANIVEAAASTRLLSLVFFCALFGFFLARIPDPQRTTVLAFWQGVLGVMMRMTEWVMRFAPLGVFGLTARALAKSGLDAARPLLLFSACVIGGLALYSFIALPLLIRLAARVSPWRLFPALLPAMATAFSTASSAASLPMTLECVEHRAGVSARITGFVVPLGVSLNHAGSALYECAAALFIAQAYGVHLSVSAQVVVVLLALIASMGIAAVPAASLVGLATILAAIGLPVEAIGLLLVVDRVLDMSRTSVNVLADGACAVIVARQEGESGVLSGYAAVREKPA